MMETVKTAYHNAEHALWGDTPRKAAPSSEEPISGIQGAGTATDPYDAGNSYPAESTESIPTKAQAGGTSTTSKDPVLGSGEAPKGNIPVRTVSSGVRTGDNSMGAIPQATTRVGDAERSQTWSSGSEEFPSNTRGPIISSTTDAPTSSYTTGQGIGEPKVSPIETSIPSTGGDLSQKSTNGSGLSPESTGPLNPTARRTQSNGLHTQRTPIGITSEKASPEFIKEHDDTPRTGHLRSHPSEVDEETEPNAFHSRGPPIPLKQEFLGEEEFPSGEETATGEARRPMQSPGGVEQSTPSKSSANEKAQGVEEHEAPKEEYVKTTGFAAEGGNFDATLPGAGREADRLMGHEGKPAEDAGDLRKKSVASTSSKEHHGGLWKGSHKSGLTMSNVKEKLHIGKHHP